jgi:hypothetical protein
MKTNRQATDVQSITQQNKKQKKDGPISLKECKTFEQVCLVGAKYANDEDDVHESLGWCDSGCTPNLYEMVRNYSWIRPIIHQYNKLGFYTRMSQPGCNDSIIKSKSLYGSMKQTDIYLNNGNQHTHKQRAMIMGYMRCDRATKIYNILKNDPYLMVGLHSINNGDIPNYSWITSSFTNNEITPNVFDIIKLDHPNYDRMTARQQNIINKKYPADFKSYAGAHCSINNFTKELPKLASSCFDTKSPEYLDYIEIFDKRWDNNDYLWNKVLDILQKIK